MKDEYGEDQKNPTRVSTAKNNSSTAPLIPLDSRADRYLCSVQEAKNVI